MPDEATSTKPLYLVILVVSAATLGIQLIHMRLLSLAMWNSLVYCVITVTLLGFSVSGGVLTVWKRATQVKPEELIGGAVLGFVVSNLVGVAVAGRISIDASKAIDNPFELLKLGAYFVALSVPYFFAGFSIGASFLRYPAKTTRLYCVNMAGSGVGCLLFVLLFEPLGTRLMILLSAISGLAALVYTLRSSPRNSVALGVAGVLTLALLPITNTAFTVHICESKNYHYFLTRFPDLRIEYSRWTIGGRVDVMGSPALEHVNRRTNKRFPMKVILTDGDAYTRMFAFSGNPDAWPFPRREFGSGTVYELMNPEHVVIIGIGGGTEVRDAMAHGAENVVGVELNRAIFDAVNSVYSHYNGHLGESPGVTLLHGEGRSYINTVQDSQYDLVYMNGVDTWAAMASGAYTLAENYLYTVEAMREYLRVLRADGFLSISRYAFRVPRESLRLGITAIEALEESGVERPWDHVAMLVDQDWGTILVKKSPLTPQDIRKLEGLQDAGWFKIAYRPGLENARVTEENLARYGRDVWHPAPYRDALNPAVAFVKSFKGGDTESFYRNYPYDIRPCHDDNPFFFKYYKWSSLLEGQPEWAASGGSFAMLVLAVLLVGSILALVTLVFVPLALVSRRSGPVRVDRRSMGAAWYFTCLGIGYMVIELALMQKLTLFLGHPTYSIAAILSTMLLCSGVGSLVSGRLPFSPQRVIVLSVVALSVIVVLHQFLFLNLLPTWLSQPILARNLIAAGLVAPLAFCMGMPFPSGLRIVDAVAPRFAPWAWSINGAASVFATIGAIVAAMYLGFTYVLLACTALYLSGAAVFLAAFHAPNGNAVAPNDDVSPE